MDQKAEIDRLRWMLHYASESPTLEAARTICRDALNGVGGAYNVEQVRSEVERLREALVAIRDHDPLTCDGIKPSDCLETVQEIARAALAPGAR